MLPRRRKFPPAPRHFLLTAQDIQKSPVSKGRRQTLGEGENKLMEIRKGLPNCGSGGQAHPDNRDYIDFINYVFGMNGSSSSFRKLLPKLYKQGRRPEDFTYFSLENEKITGAVGAFPLEYVIAGEKFSCTGIGNVASHPEMRGQGTMRALMNAAISDMITQDVDLSVLGGRRHRYNHFGYEKCSGLRYFKLSSKTVSYLMPPPEDICAERLERDDTALLDELCERMNKRSFFVRRKREDLYDILTTWEAQPYVFYKNSRPAGWCVKEKDGDGITEFFPFDPADSALLAACAAYKFRSASIALPPTEPVIADLIEPLCENIVCVSTECFLVLNWEKLLRALFRLKASYSPLCDGELVLEIDGIKSREILKISVKEGSADIERLDEATLQELCADSRDKMRPLKLSQNAAQALVFGFYRRSEYALAGFAASWFPLPLFVPSPDNV